MLSLYLLLAVVRCQYLLPISLQNSLAAHLAPLRQQEPLPKAAHHIEPVNTKHSPYFGTSKNQSPPPPRFVHSAWHEPYRATVLSSYGAGRLDDNGAGQRGPARAATRPARGHYTPVMRYPVFPTAGAIKIPSQIRALGAHRTELSPDREWMVVGVGWGGGGGARVTPPQSRIHSWRTAAECARK